MGKPALSTLFRESVDRNISDGSTTIKLRFQSLNRRSQKMLARLLDTSRDKASEYWKERRHLVVARVNEVADDKVIDSIIESERGTVVTVTDLAPNASDEEKEKYDKEKEAEKKWEELRREELAGMDMQSQRDILLERAVNNLVTRDTYNDWLEQSVCEVVVDRETNQRIFTRSDSAKDLETYTHVDDISPELYDQLLEIWRGFMNEMSAKKIREAARSGDFLDSGESLSPDSDSPGETTETQ